MIRTGDTISTSQGPLTVFKVDFPRSGQGGHAADHRWEQQIMESTGRMVINVTFANGFTSDVYTQ